MHPANIPEQLRARCYCPCCGDQLALGVSADPWAICLVCPRGHRFFIMPQTPLAVDTARAAGTSFPELSSLSPPAIASFWLSDPQARSVLNEQLAQLLRAIVESRSVADEPRLSLCPTCGNTFGDCEQPDIYVQGLRCTNGHFWSLRGGQLTSLIQDKCLTLQTECADATVSQLIGAWLDGDPHLEPNLHNSIRHVLMSSPLCPRDRLKRGD